MEWIDIACIVFVCVTVSHLGLVGAIEDMMGRNLPVINCPKCLTFWVTLAYGCDTIATNGTLIMVLAISFLCSYLAIWLELFEGYIDTLYLKLYGKICTTSDDTPATDTDGGNTTSTVS